ncbi:MAG: glycosyltransferase family 4 protein, partial [Phycisphaeraceae bacterium]
MPAMPTSRPPQRVLLLTRGGPMNGCQYQMQYLIEGLDRRRFEPIVAAPRADGELAALAQLGVQTHVLPMRDWRRYPAALGRPLDLWRLARWAARWKPALVHGADFWKGRYAIALGRALRIPSVVHVRGPFQARDVRKYRLDRASALVAIAQRFAADLVSFGVPASKVTLIDDSVDTSRYRPRMDHEPDVLGELYPAARGVRVGLVGRIEPFKRQLDYLEAVAPLARAHPDHATFFLIGAVGDERYHRRVLEFIHQQGLADRVVRTGRREDMAAVMQSLDVLVTFSGGSVMFEAMACGKPVVSVRDDPRHSTHVRHEETGLRVTGREPARATTAIQRLIEDPSLRARLGEAARRWVTANLTTHTMAERTAALYDQLLAASASTDAPPEALDDSAANPGTARAQRSAAARMGRSGA